MDVMVLGDGERQVAELALEDREVQETRISDRDVILIKSSTIGRMLHGFGLNSGIPGLASFGYHDPVK